MKRLVRPVGGDVYVRTTRRAGVGCRDARPAGGSSGPVARFVPVLLPLLGTLVAAATQQAPVFRSGVDLVTVDVSVVDDRGRPVVDLTTGDFRLEIDGRPRAIVSAQFVSRGGRISDLGSAPGNIPASDSSANDASGDSRVILVAVDQANIERLGGRATMRMFGEVLHELDARDRVAVVAVDHRGRLDLRAGRYLSRTDLERLTGARPPASLEPGPDLVESLDIADGLMNRLDHAARRECGRPGPRTFDRAPDEADGDVQLPCVTQLEREARAMAALGRTQAALSVAGLVNLIARLEAIDGAKTLVVLSEGFPAEPQAEDLARLGAVAQSAGVAVYALRLEPSDSAALGGLDSWMRADDVRRRADGLDRLAQSAGGALFRQVGGDPEPLRRVLRERSGSYLIGFEPTATDRDGKPHRIRVSLTGRNASLRAPAAFRLESASAIRRRREARIVGLLRSSTVTGDLPIRVTSYVFTDPGTGQVRLLIGAETRGPSVSASEAIFAYVLLDGRGVIVASGVLDTPSPRFLSSAVVAPGHYELRVAAVDRLGRSGSVTRAVSAVANVSELPTSDLVVARAGEGSEDHIDPIFEVTTDDAVLSYLELYPRPGQSLRNIDVVISVRPAMGGAVALSRPALIWSLDPRQAIARLTVPLAGLPPGPYVVRADVSDADRILGFAERRLTMVR